MLVAGGVVAGGLTGSLVGCAATPGRTDTSDPWIKVVHVNVDGVDTPCVIYETHGISCKFGGEVN